MELLVYYKSNLLSASIYFAKISSKNFLYSSALTEWMILTFALSFSTKVFVFNPLFSPEIRNETMSFKDLIISYKSDDAVVEGPPLDEL